jgi:choline-sulfatase
MKKPILIFFLWAVFFGAGIAQQKPRPSIIIIMADQLRADAIGESTPNITALARDGVAFSRAYCASPICVPSRGAFFTGRYPNRNGSLINGWQIADAEFANVKAGTPNLYGLLEQEWDSHHVGKQHFFTEERIDKQPGTKTRWVTSDSYSAWMKARGVAKPGGPEFKGIVPELVSGTSTHIRPYSIPKVGRYEGGIENFTDHYFGNESVSAIKNRDRKKPLLLNAMFLAPHPPFDVPEPYFSLVRDEDVVLPENVGKWYDGQSPLQLYNLPGFLGARYSREDWRDVWAKYKGLVRLLDDEVGRIVKALKEEGIYDESVIVFAADHGEMLGSHSLWQKMCMYEESAHVPLIIKLPKRMGTHAGEASTPVSLIDVFPTLLELAGVGIPEGVDGVSLMPFMRSTADAARPVFIQYDGNGSLGNFQRCVVSGDHKLIVDMFKDECFLELYNVREDPQETTNLAFKNEFNGQTAKLVDLLRRHMEATGDRLRLPGDVYSTFVSHYKPIKEK